MTRPLLSAASFAASLALLAPSARAQDADDPPPQAVGVPRSSPGAPQGLGPEPPPPARSGEMFSGTMVIIGGTMMGLGLFGVTGGAISIGLGDGVKVDTNARAPSWVAVIAGSGLLLAGLPLVLIGAHRPAAPAAARRPKEPWIGLAPNGVLAGMAW